MPTRRKRKKKVINKKVQYLEVSLKPIGDLKSFRLISVRKVRGWSMFKPKPRRIKILPMSSVIFKGVAWEAIYYNLPTTRILRQIWQDDKNIYSDTYAIG